MQDRYTHEVYILGSNECVMESWTKYNGPRGGWCVLEEDLSHGVEHKEGRGQARDVHQVAQTQRLGLEHSLSEAKGRGRG
jgi:hypothetical protein